MVFTVRLTGRVLCMLYLRRDVLAVAMASLLSTGSSTGQSGHVRRNFPGGSWGRKRERVSRIKEKSGIVNALQ